MYYAARRNGGQHCIGAATSTHASGPYTPQANPLICNDAGGGLIDPAGWDDGKNRWIVYKVDGSNFGGATTCPNGGKPGPSYLSTAIMLQKVGRDALTLQGSPKKILDNLGAADNGITESPSLTRASNGRFILFFSTHCFSSDDYNIEYAWSDTIDGSYGERGTLLKTQPAGKMFGPGSFDVAPNFGKPTRQGVFHAREYPNEGAGGARKLYSATITFNGNGLSY